LEIGQVRVI